MSWAIICDSREDAGGCVSTLALVDRSVRKDLWWTSDDDCSIMQFVHKEAAQQKCQRLVLNNARVVPHRMAVDVIRRQERDIMDKELENEGEGPGWDAHKGAF